MSLPFSAAEFLAVFARYNHAVWPAQAVLVALAVLALFLAARPAPGADRIVAGVLAFFWGWMGVAYHWTFFAAINPAAYLFGALFVAQAALLLDAGVLRPRLAFRPRADAAGIVGAVLIAYALVGYPLLGSLFGQRYPAAPTFGLPCPTTIFTFGLLLWADRRMPSWLLAIPVAWSVLGVSAALSLGIAEDWGLPAAAIVTVAALLLRNASARKHIVSRGEVETPGGPSPHPVT